MNSTERNYSIYLITPRPWLRDEIFLYSLTAVSLYLVIVLIIFEVRNRKQNKTKEVDFSKILDEFLSCGSLCLVAVIITLIRCLLEHLELRLGRSSDLACRIYQHLLVEVFHLALMCLYLLLWSRQLKMYRHKALRHLGSPLLRVISILVLFGIVGSSVASATSYLVTFTLIKSPVGCVYDLSFPDGPPSSLPGYLLFVISFVFQSALLALLVYPLAKHYHLRLCCCRVPHHRNQEHIKRMIIRLSICTTVCILSDLVSSSLLIFVHDGITPIMFWANVYTLNLILNILAVVCSFADWKERLFPWCYKVNGEPVNPSSTGPSTNSAV